MRQILIKIKETIKNIRDHSAISSCSTTKKAKAHCYEAWRVLILNKRTVPHNI